MFDLPPYRLAVLPRWLLCVSLAAFLTGLASAAPEISQLEVQQPMTLATQVYSVTPALKISFNLAAPANVTVEIRRHLAAYYQFKWPWLMEPFLVRTLPLGQLAAGPHSVDWDGLDDQSKPIVETHNLTEQQILQVQQMGTKITKPEQLTETVPVNNLQVRVKAGAEQLSANFERGVKTLQPNRTALPFMMATPDKEGHYLVTNFLAWSVYRYTPDFVLDANDIIPRPSLIMGLQPAECRIVHVDSKGFVLIQDTVGIWRFDSKGVGAPWPHQDKYMRDGCNGIVLGNRAQDPVQSAQIGFAMNFTGFAIDDKDNLYLARESSDPCIEVFDDNANYLRKLPLAPGKVPGNIAWEGNNTLAVATGDSLELMDATTGAVKKTIPEVHALFLQTDRDGNIYTGPEVRNIWRYTPAGDPLPFNPALPNVKANNLILSTGLIPGLAAGAAGYAPNGLWGFAFAPDGSFYTSETPGPDATVFTRTGLLHYAKDGTFLPENLTVIWGCHAVANVYLDNQPATMDLIVNNFTDQKQPFTVHWTLTDFDGKKTSGTSPLTAAPMARQILSFTPDMPEMGHYYLEAEVREGDKFIEKLTAQVARIPSRPIFADRYSPFAVAWIGEWEVMAMAGAKSHRGDSASWEAQVEPVDGVFFPEHPDVPQWGRSGADGLRSFAHKNGFLLLNGLDYGEHWLGGGQSFYSYDRFYDYCLHVIENFSGKGEAFYQFWNEPNFYWRFNIPDPFSREQFMLVQQHVWSMIKARDKNVLSIGDGNAGNLDIMQQFYDFGASGYIDTLQTHYPASTPLAFNNMQVPDLPETKAVAMTKLVDLRDKLYPGKEVWNTEENIPGTPPTPELTATNLPRVEIPQIAIGVDKIYQFSQTALGTTLHDVTALIDEFGQPFPTYVTYATMTRMIDGAVFCGQPDFGAPGTYGYLFARAKDFVLVANSIAEDVPVTIDAGAPSVTVIDIVGRSHRMPTDGGKLKITLSKRVQYILLPRDGPAKNLAKVELKKELDAMQVASATDIANQMSEAVKTAATNLPAMNKLYHLVKAAEVAEAAGEAPPGGNATEAKAARQAVEKREGDDGYLRQSRLALDWAEHCAQIAGHDPTMAWPTLLAAQAAEGLAAAESPCYPGAVISAYIGEPGAIEKIRATVPVANNLATGIEDQFRFQIDRKAGDTFELELTVCDYYRHKIDGTVTPRLPAGWQAAPASATYSVQPGKWQRFMFTVTIPADAKPGVIPVGGQTTYNGAPVQELHAMRIHL